MSREPHPCCCTMYGGYVEASDIKQYIGEMETRFIKENDMVFGNFEGKDDGGAFLTAFFKAVILVVLPSTSDTPPNHGQFWR